jgi:predicted DNA-binding transcriptional regulator AlpA
VTRDLTTAELADRLQVSVGTLANWRSTGKPGDGPRYRKSGNRVRYPIAEVEQWEAGRLHVRTHERAS